MLVVEETPVHCHERVEDAHATVERELRNLRGRYLSESVAEFGDCGIFVDVEALGKEAVVAGLLDAVSYRAGGFEMNSLGQDKGA